MSDGLTEAMRGMKLGPEEPKPTSNQKYRKFINITKSIIRIIGCGLVVMDPNYITMGFFMFFIAEIIGILSEIK